MYTIKSTFVCFRWQKGFRQYRDKFTVIQSRILWWIESGVDVFYPEGLRGAWLPEVRAVNGRRRRGRRTSVRRRDSAIRHYDPSDDVVEDPYDLTEDDWRWARRCALMALPERQNNHQHGSRGWWNACCRL
jgi:hypothetical protein